VCATVPGTLTRRRRTLGGATKPSGLHRKLRCLTRLQPPTHPNSENKYPRDGRWAVEVAPVYGQWYVPAQKGTKPLVHS
jgi:hypothetical protein